MKKAIDFYDTINEKTDKKQHSWNTFRHRFQKMKSRMYIECFRKYFESLWISFDLKTIKL